MARTVSLNISVKVTDDIIVPQFRLQRGDGTWQPLITGRPERADSMRQAKSLIFEDWERVRKNRGPYRDYRIHRKTITDEAIPIYFPENPGLPA